MSEPRTKAGRHYIATMFGRERSDVFDVTQTEAAMKAAIRRIEDDAAALSEVQPPAPHQCHEHWPTPTDFGKFTDDQFLAYCKVIGFDDQIKAALAERALPPATPSLDAAWAEAEAVLPEGWMLELVHSGVVAGDINPHTGYPVEWPPTHYYAVAQPSWEGSLDIEYREAGPTAAAALHNLAARLSTEGAEPK